MRKSGVGAQESDHPNFCDLQSSFNGHVTDAADDVVGDGLVLLDGQDVHGIRLVLRAQHEVLSRQLHVLDGKAAVPADGVHVALAAAVGLEGVVMAIEQHGGVGKQAGRHTHALAGRRRAAVIRDGAAAGCAAFQRPIDGGGAKWAGAEERLEEGYFELDEVSRKLLGRIVWRDYTQAEAVKGNLKASAGSRAPFLLCQTKRDSGASSPAEYALENEREHAVSPTLEQGLKGPKQKARKSAPEIVNA